MLLTLRHATTGETREVPIVEAERGLRLVVRWDLAGLYVVDLRKRALLRSPRGAATPWRVADIEVAWRLWRELCAPAVDPPRILGLPLGRTPWRPEWATKKKTPPPSG